MDKIRVVHCGTGPTGITGLRGIVNHPDLQLVGHLVFDPSKAGKDSGELGKLGGEVGVSATTDIDALIALEPDYLVYLGDGLGKFDSSLEVIVRFLEAGVNVGTAALFGTLSAQTTPPPLRDRLNAACKAGNSSYYFSGIDPGFANPWLATALLKGADEVEEIRMQELSNYGVYPVEWIMRDIFGFGRGPDYQSPLSDPGHIQHVFGSSVSTMADRIGIKLDELRPFFHSALHHEAHETFWGTVDANTVAAVRFGIEGIYKGKPFITLEHVNRTTLEAAPHWPQAMLEPGKDLQHQYVMEVKGNPNLVIRMDFGLTRDREDAGLAFTAMALVNAARAIVDAPPGIVDEMDLPLYTAKCLKA